VLVNTEWIVFWIFNLIVNVVSDAPLASFGIALSVIFSIYPIYRLLVNINALTALSKEK